MYNTSITDSTTFIIESIYINIDSFVSVELIIMKYVDTYKEIIMNKISHQQKKKHIQSNVLNYADFSRNSMVEKINNTYSII